MLSNKTKNITIFCNSNAWGGLEMNNVRLAKWLLAEGHQVSIICLKDSKTAHEIENTDIKSIFFSEKTLKRGNILGAYRVYQTLKILGIKNIIVGHSRDINLAIFVKMFSNAKIKVIYQQHMRIGRSKKDFLHTFFYKKLDAWIAALPYLKKNTLDFTKVKKGNIHIIPFSIEVDKFTNTQNKKTEARDFFNLDTNKFIVGTIGRLDKGKGQEYLIDVIAKLRQANYDIEGLFIGDETKGEEGTYLPFLKEKIQKYNLENHIHFRPHTAQTDLAFAVLDIFAMTSLYETFGMVTIEAMASGIAVVGSNTGGTSELIEDNKTGLLFESKNVEDLANKLKMLLDKPELSKKLINEAQKAVIESYSHKVQIEKIGKLLK